MAQNKKTNTLPASALTLMKDAKLNALGSNWEHFKDTFIDACKTNALKSAFDAQIKTATRGARGRREEKITKFNVLDTSENMQKSLDMTEQE